MVNSDIAHRRLHTQRIAGAPFERPEDAVRWLGAVQAQDYGPAQWALGLRLRDGKDSDVEAAFADGAILRTHVMRPTWHFVTPADIRWLLALTAPRVNAFMAYYNRKLELDDALFARSNDVLAKALQGGKQATRTELASELRGAGIATDGTQRLAHIVMRAELDAIICSGARRGKQFTYALIDERAPEARTLQRDEALAELVRRYFTSHGPALVKDFAWWSGLTTADAKDGLEMVKPQLMSEVIGGQTYWFGESTPFVRDKSPTAYLLPNYDEYVIGYKDRTAVFDLSHSERVAPGGDVYIGHMIVMDGEVVGAWTRTFSKGAVVISAHTFTKLNDAESQAFATAASRYGAFLGMLAVLE